MIKFTHDQILVELWPSLTEIQASKRTNAYKRGLTEFYESVHSLLETLGSHNLAVEAFTDDHLDRGEMVLRDFPPEIVELAAWLGSSGIALALYKALRLWVDFKNGRRIKIVEGGFEVEATQLTQEQFVELIEILRQRREKPTDSIEIKKTLEQKGLNPVSVDSEERMNDRRVLKNAARSRANSDDA